MHVFLHASPAWWHSPPCYVGTSSAWHLTQSRRPYRTDHALCIHSGQLAWDHRSWHYSYCPLDGLRPLHFCSKSRHYLAEAAPPLYLRHSAALEAALYLAQPVRPAPRLSDHTKNNAWSSGSPACQGLRCGNSRACPTSCQLYIWATLFLGHSSCRRRHFFPRPFVLPFGPVTLAIAGTRLFSLSTIATWAEPYQ
jgi:hypothetical protein